MLEKSTNDLSSPILEQLEAQIDTIDENMITRLQEKERSNSFAVSSIFPYLDVISFQLCFERLA